MMLFFGTWLIGSLHPIPETVFYLFHGPVQTGPSSSWSHSPEWFDFQFLPIIGAFSGETVLVSGLIAVFCVVCSALDRWDWKKTTGLSGISAFSMQTLEERIPWGGFQSDWVVLTIMQFLIVGGVVLIYRPLREA